MSDLTRGPVGGCVHKDLHQPPDRICSAIYVCFYSVALTGFCMVVSSMLTIRPIWQNSYEHRAGKTFIQSWIIFWFLFQSIIAQSILFLNMRYNISIPCAPDVPDPVPDPDTTIPWYICISELNIQQYNIISVEPGEIEFHLIVHSSLSLISS